jgi:uncharacterized membrane protein (UPF0127 family)
VSMFVAQLPDLYPIFSPFLLFVFTTIAVISLVMINFNYYVYVLYVDSAGCIAQLLSKVLKRKRHARIYCRNAILYKIARVL